MHDTLSEACGVLLSFDSRYEIAHNGKQKLIAKRAHLHIGKLEFVVYKNRQVVSHNLMI